MVGLAEDLFEEPPVEGAEESLLGEPPELPAVSDSEDEFSETSIPSKAFYDALESIHSDCSEDSFLEPREVQVPFGDMTDVYSCQIKLILNRCQPYPGDVDDEWGTLQPVDGPRFDLTRYNRSGQWVYKIVDHKRGIEAHIVDVRLRYDMFSLGRWYATICAKKMGDPMPGLAAQLWLSTQPYYKTIMGSAIENRIEFLLNLCAPYVGENEPDIDAPPRFEVSCNVVDINNFVVKDYLRNLHSTVPRDLAHQEKPHLLIHSYKLKYARICEKSVDISCQ